MLSATQMKWAAYAAVLAGAFAAGWFVRSNIAIADMAEYREGIESAAQEQRVFKAKADAATDATKQASSARLDKTQAAAQTRQETTTVQVIKYVSNPDHGKCTLPADWVRAYNAALFGGDAVPETETARRQAPATPAGVPANGDR